MTVSGMVGISPPLKRILTVNGGSSGIKFAVFTSGTGPHLTVRGQIERIGPDAVFSTKGDLPVDNISRPVGARDFATAVAVLMDWVDARQNGDDGGLIAIGHRVVHGGQNYHKPQQLTPSLLEELRGLCALDPTHMTGEILLMQALRERFPHLPQTVCFDTAFHHDLPRVARILPIPRRYEAQGVRRYGFHGLSYEFLMSELIRIEGAPAGKGRVIMAHLGNGASLAAVNNGKPIDTSMGFTPASGVPMGSRSGDIDPGLAWYLARTEGMNAAQFDEMVNEKSGLLGVSETSADMRDLLRSERNDPRAAEAVTLFCYQIRKTIGAFAAALGGLDTLIFSGGVGENAPAVRLRICEGLGFLGIELDPAYNAESAPLISTATARVSVRVVPANEELVIARAVYRALVLTEKSSATPT